MSTVYTAQGLVFRTNKEKLAIILVYIGAWKANEKGSEEYL